MNAIILAAGEGKRLRPLTEDRPKCLIDFHGKTLLDRQISVFKKCGIDDISVVTGYNADMFHDNKLEYFLNENFANTNMVKSLFCAEKKILDTTIVCYGDIIFESKVLEKLIDSKDDFSVVIDKNWEEYWKLRFDNPIDDAESLKVDQTNYITDIGQKISDINEIDGQYIGLIKFQNDAPHKIKTFFYKCQREYYENEINLLHHNRTFDNSYMTDFLQGLIHNGEKLKAVNIENGWLEFDNMDDYELYVNDTSMDIIRGFYNENN